MINGLFWLLGCQVVGEVGVRILHLSVPGPVLGMVILFVLLWWRKPAETSPIFRASDGLLRHLQLLFIPAGVGVITLLSQIADAPLPLIGGLLISWVVGLVAVGWIVTLLLRVRHD